jgi:hypothetical protein
MNIVRHDQHVVARRDNILLQEIGTHRISERFGFLSMLRQISASAAMGNDQRPLSHGCSLKRRLF